jgi:aminopeptidase N
MILTAAALALLLQQQPERFPAQPEQDARRYELDLRVDLDAQQLHGTVVYTFTALQDLTSIRLDAKRSADWTVRFTTMSGQPIEAEWHAEHCIVPLARTAAKGSDVRFRAELSGRPVDGFYFQKNRYGAPMAFTDHYSIRARGWLPCEDHPSDRAVFVTTLRCASDQQAVAFGLSQGVLGPAEKGYVSRRFVGGSEIPPYMYALVVGPLERVAEAGDPRLVDHFVYPEDVAKAKRSLVHHAAWIAAMEATFGAYPYGKYTTVQCPTRWGGFEAPGNVQLAEGLFDRGGVGTLAHELVHMWFGDAIGYAAWREVWLSEGFASYFGPWLHAQTGGPTLQQSLANLRERWRNSFEGRTKTIRDDRFAHPDQALNANTYPKGAWVLHMLRGEVGDEAFFAALKAYVAQFRGQSITTRQFVACIEQQTGEELSWFFDQWLDRVGCPTLQVARTSTGLRIEQIQQGAPYRCWLRLRWQGQDGRPAERRVRLDGARTDVAIDGPCDELQLDPDVELLFRSAK